MSVQFDPITRLTPVHLGSWWTPERRRKYPLCEERPPLAPEREEFEPKTEPAFSLRLAGAPPTPAVWFLSKDRSELLQVQRDRFTRNWTRESPEAAPYPSYTELLPKFIEDFNDFREFLSAEGFAQPSVVQCELTYLNPLPATPHYWETHGDIERFFALWGGQTTEGFLPAPEDAQIAVRYVVPDDRGMPIGRLYVTLQPAVREDGAEVYLLNLTVRGRPGYGGNEGVLSFFDVAHEWIVRGFTTLTTKPMHQLWGRTQ